MHAELSGKGSVLSSMGMGHGAAMGIGIRKRRRTCLAELAKAAWPAPGATLDFDYINNQGYMFGRGIASALSLTETTRGSTKTYTNSAGVSSIAAINEAVIDYHPVTFLSRGMPLAELRTNLSTYSEQFDNAAHSKLRSTITANAATARDGTVTMDKLCLDTTAADNHSTFRSYAVTNGTAYTKSVDVKADDLSWVAIAFTVSSSAFAYTAAYFNAATGTIGVTGSPAAADIEDMGNGIYRCSLTATATATTTGVVAIYLAEGDGDVTFPNAAGVDAGKGVFLWGDMFEAASFAGPYIPTVASQVTRSGDVSAITGQNFERFINKKQGCFVIEWSVPVLGIDNNIISVNDGTTNNRHQHYLTTSSSIIVRSAANAVATNTSFANYASIAVDVPQKSVVAYGDGVVSTCLNGGAVNTSTQTLPDVLTLLGIGCLGYAAVGGVKHIRRLTYYPVKPPNNMLPALGTL